MDTVRDITITQGRSCVMVADKDGFVKKIIPREDEFKKDVFESWDGNKVIILD